MNLKKKPKKEKKLTNNNIKNLDLLNKLTYIWELITTFNIDNDNKLNSSKFKRIFKSFIFSFATSLIIGAITIIVVLFLTPGFWYIGVIGGVIVFIVVFILDMVRLH